MLGSHVGSRASTGPNPPICALPGIARTGPKAPVAGPGLLVRTAARWLAKRVDRPLTVRCTMATNIMDAIAGGAGLGIIPCVVGDADQRMVRIYDDVELETNTSWLVYHQDLRKVPANQILSDRITKIFAELP